MQYFKLPDLGEGLQDAEIVEWHAREGDQLKVDDLLVSVETAKAIVEIPSPYDGKVVAILAKVGSTVDVGAPLVEFDLENNDNATVVGKMETVEDDIASLHQFVIGSPEQSDLETHATINININRTKESNSTQERNNPSAERLTGVTKNMAKNIERAQQEVAQVTIFDDAIITHWSNEEDTTVRLAQAIAYACQQEPKLNAKYYGDTYELEQLEKVDLATAVDTEQGLFAPVLRNIHQRGSENLIAGLNTLRQDVINRSIPPSELIGATITLSNFGTMGGRYATPLVIPPTVTILGAGSIRKEPLVITENNQDQIIIAKVLPLSLSFDHRPITGGEAARFLKAVKEHLEKD